MNQDEALSKYGNLLAECRIRDITVGPGWQDIVGETLDRLARLPSCRVFQIKEKFGGLRIYTQGSPNDSAAIALIVKEAEAKAWQTCDTCGKPGKQNTEGWIRTLCDECRAERRCGGRGWGPQ